MHKVNAFQSACMFECTLNATLNAVVFSHSSEGHGSCVRTAAACRFAQLHLLAAQVQIFDDLVDGFNLLLCVQVDQDGPLEGDGGEPEQAVEGADHPCIDGDPEQGGAAEADAQVLQLVSSSLCFILGSY
jgi:hypothetical protein